MLVEEAAMSMTMISARFHLPFTINNSLIGTAPFKAVQQWIVIKYNSIFNFMALHILHRNQDRLA